MRGIGIVLVLLGVGYLVHTQGLPRLREMKAEKTAVAAQVESSRSCVERAREVSQNFSSDISQFSRPPVERDLWASFLLRSGAELSSADTACSCSTESCASAAAALLELRSLLNALDVFVRAEGPPVVDAAARLDRVERMLQRAERQQG